MSRRDDDAMNVFDPTPFKVEWANGGHATEESIYAWLDGALGAQDNEAIERHVGNCDDCAAAVAEARGYIAASVRIMNAADLSPRHVVPSDDVARTAARIVAMADQTRVIQKNVPSRRSSERTKESVRAWHAHPFMRAAAVLILVSGTYFVTRDSSTARVDGGASVAKMPNVAAPRSIPETVRAVKPAEPNRVLAHAVRARVAKESGPARQKKPALNGAQSLSAVVVQATATPTETKKMAFTTSVVTAADLDAVTRTTLSGAIVDRATSAPLSSALVTVPGTSLSTGTDADGKFVLRDVPAAARSLQVRRIGYAPVEVPVDSVRDAGGSVTVSLALAPTLLTGVVVTSVPARSSERPTARTNSCFVANSELSGNEVPMVRRIAARQELTGSYTATLFGWPTSNAQTDANMTIDSAGVLRGSAQAGGARLEVELTPQGDNWFSTLREYRNNNIHSRNIKFLRDALSDGCL